MDAAGPTDAGARLRLPLDVPSLFADVASIGPFFAVATGAPPPGGGWVTLRALHREPAALRARIADVRAALGMGTSERPCERTVDPARPRIVDRAQRGSASERVAASIAFQGLAAQVVAPLYAAVVLHGVLPAAPDGSENASWRPVVVADGPAAATCVHEAAGVIDGAGRGGRITDTVADALHWRPGGGGPWLWWAGTAGWVVACPDPDAAALGGVLTGLLGPLVAAVRAQVSIADRVLWGDVASAVASARRLVAAARPEVAERATAVAERLLIAAPLARTVALRAPEPPDVGWTFRRRSCCLYYRVPGGAVCEDCVLHDRRRRG